VGRAPPLALIVEDAARVEAQIAADGAHVTVRGPGDRACGLCHHWIVLRDLAVESKLGQRHRRSDLETTLVGSDGAQLRDAVHVDEYWRRNNAAPQVDDEVRTTAQQTAVGMSRARVEHAGQGGGAQQLEFG